MRFIACMVLRFRKSEVLPERATSRTCADSASRDSRASGIIDRDYLYRGYRAKLNTQFAGSTAENEKMKQQELRPLAKCNLNMRGAIRTH